MQPNQPLTEAEMVREKYGFDTAGRRQDAACLATLENVRGYVEELDQSGETIEVLWGKLGDWLDRRIAEAKK